LSVEIVEIGFDVVDGALVLFLGRQFQQALRVAEAGGQVIDSGNNQFQIGAFLAQRLSPLRIIPDRRRLKLPFYFDQPFTAVIVVKDTP